MNSVIMITQFFFTLVVGMYFFTKLRNEKSDSETLANNSKKEAEHLNCMRHIHLSEPVTETARPKNVNEIIGQDDGIRAIKAALCGPDPQHILIYGPAVSAKQRRQGWRWNVQRKVTAHRFQKMRSLSKQTQR